MALNEGSDALLADGEQLAGHCLLAGGSRYARQRVVERAEVEKMTAVLGGGNPSATRGLRQETANYSEGAPHNVPPEEGLVAIIWARIQSSR